MNEDLFPVDNPEEFDPKKVQDEIWKGIRDMKDRGFSNSYIANLAGVSESKIRAILEEMK